MYHSTNVQNSEGEEEKTIKAKIERGLNPINL